MTIQDARERVKTILTHSPEWFDMTDEDFEAIQEILSSYEDLEVTIGQMRAE